MALTDSQKQKISQRALQVAERNLASGVWKVAAAQLFLKTAEEQPEEHRYLLRRTVK